MVVQLMLLLMNDNVSMGREDGSIDQGRFMLIKISYCFSQEI